MQQIIRIEDPVTGYGVWRALKNDSYLSEQSEFHDEMYYKHFRFPTPGRDIGLGYIDPTEFCAFKSIEQLQEWFEKEWLKSLIEIGFKILLLEVSKCRTGTHQILYKKEDITDTKDISNLFI